MRVFQVKIPYPLCLICCSSSFTLPIVSNILIVWPDSLFIGTVVHSMVSVLTLKITCKLNQQTFYISNIYGPAHSQDKSNFISWLTNLDVSDFNEWVLLGDFNLIRSAENRSIPGGCPSEMMMFNDLISFRGLIDLPFQERSFTWSNMQDPPILVKLDWVFCNSGWLMAFPNSSVWVLSRPISDHVPCLAGPEWYSEGSDFSV